MAFKKAVKYDAKGRIALAGPAGSGKTYTALTLATALADGKEIALIDTERGSASKYADLFSFDVMELDTFHPDKFVAGIKEAEAAGYAVLVIDSLSHAWNGPGGLLEIVDQIARRSQSKNTFNAWGDATPIQQRLTDALTRSNMHIIVTMRSKTEYVVEQNAQGKSVPRKVGTAPIQRDGMEYEFDVFADMDIDNTMIVQKSRCPALTNAVIAKPDTKVAETLKAWLSGEAAPAISVVASSNGRQADADPPATDQQLASIRKLCEHLGKEPEPQMGAMSYLQAKAMIGKLSLEYREMRKEEPSISATMQRMIEIAKKRASDLGVDWDLLKASVFGEPVPDAKLITVHFVKINGELTKREAA